MSDPCARRGDNVMALLENMVKSGRGWNRSEIMDFLFVRYRMGVREETLQAIFNQLKDRGIIYGKPKVPNSNIYVYFVNTQVLEALTGVKLPKEEEPPKQEKQSRKRKQ
jgi:hypothetical protein